MRKPTSFLDDVSISEEDEEETDYAAPLCCPDDPLDEVLLYIPTLDKKVLEALGIDWSSPSPQEEERLLGYSPSAAGEDHGDLKGMVAAAGNSYPAATSADCSLSSTSWESESSDKASSFLYWHVPTKPRRQAVNVRKRPWSHPFLAVPSTPVAAAAAVQDTHGINKGINAGDFGELSYDNASKLRKLSLDDDDGGGNFRKVLGFDGNNVGNFGSGNGSGGRRRLAGRQRGGHQGPCRHCHTMVTPQWRAGPDGPATLCNACGIRYRMGGDKLVPEYRPSTSPFFRSGEYSNRHSKVEKLREKKVKALKVGFGPAGALTPARSGGSVDRTVP